MKARGTADLSSERERFAEALMVERVHGDGAVEYIIDRMTTLAILGDEAGVQRWREIADRLVQLQRRGLIS